MGKIKLTQKQADAIERLKEHHTNEIKRFKLNPTVFSEWLMPLNEMDVDGIEDALYVGYEVEPEFKVGDWIVNDCGEIVHLSKMQAKMANGLNDNSHLRHATDEEIAKEKKRRWWAKHNRDVWEIRGSDVLFDEELKEIVVVRNSGVLPDSDSIRKNYKVVCFAEDRKDA